MNVFTVPLAPAQPQRFTLVLSRVRYTLKLRWNPILITWILDVADAAGNDLANGIAVVAGVDLLNQFSYMEFPGALIAQSSDDPNAAPTLDDLGVTSGLFYIPYAQAGQVDFTREVVS